ncbi:MAG: endonuclease/exonuclease/phosphatase family protein [Melioribacteraceae bacterium]|nr:endonuclease/exonuclease/phosphatase family protein [Melioribacteraceae bacterium]
MKKLFSILVFLIIIGSNSNAQSIVIDENFSDWQGIDPLYVDDQNDEGNGNVDFKMLKITNDDRFVYFYLELKEELILQQYNDISILIDTDNNPNSGIKKNGIGYDFSYNLGRRSGEFIYNIKLEINSYDVGLVNAPTVSSNVFEFVIRKETIVSGVNLFRADTIAVIIQSLESNGDQIPEAREIVKYGFNQNNSFQPAKYQLTKNPDDDFRIMNYNVLRDNLFEQNVKENFRRILQMVDPDIIGFNEIYNHSGSQTASLIEEFLPSGNGEQWYSGDVGNDNLIVSRFPILKQTNIDGNAAYLLDLPDYEMLVIVAHPPCCENEESRQKEIDKIMAFVRDSKNGSNFNIAKYTPIIIQGDMNLVGLKEQQNTLLSGDIFYESLFGPDFTPDLDGHNFVDAKPINPGSPTTFTWYSDYSSFSAGRLDYIVYSGSVLEMTNSFALHSDFLPADTLTNYNLKRDDTILASDHLPVVADFYFRSVTSTSKKDHSPIKINLKQNYPNPFNPTTKIQFTVPSNRDMKGAGFEAQFVSLKIYNLLGENVATIVSEKMHPGNYEVDFNAENLPSSIYFYTLSIGNNVLSKKMILLR